MRNRQSRGYWRDAERWKRGLYSHSLQNVCSNVGRFICRTNTILNPRKRQNIVSAIMCSLLRFAQATISAETNYFWKSSEKKPVDFRKQKQCFLLNKSCFCAQTGKRSGNKCSLNKVFLFSRAFIRGLHLKSNWIEWCEIRLNCWCTFHTVTGILLCSGNCVKKSFVQKNAPADLWRRYSQLKFSRESKPILFLRFFHSLRTWTFQVSIHFHPRHQ